jgi:hypothetical protein
MKIGRQGGSINPTASVAPLPFGVRHINQGSRDSLNNSRRDTLCQWK